MNFIAPAFHCPDPDNGSGASWVLLEMAVSRMAVTIEDQQDQVRHFKGTLEKLQTSVDRLDQTCETYLGNLRKIRIGRLRRHSLALAKTMEESLVPRVVG